MMLKLFVCIALIATVSCKSFTDNNNNNNKFMIVLRDGSLMADINFVMSEIEMAEDRLGEEMEMKFVDFLFPVVFADLSEETVEKISALQEVAYIEKDQSVHMYPMPGLSSNTSKWLQANELTDRYNLDIIGKPQYGCMDDNYDSPNDGADADIYILDTGINYNHYDFKYSDGRDGTRAKYGGYDAVDANGDGSDCQGHGSHCAGTSGGLQSGVAKGANLLSVRVLGCSGSGSTSGIVTALNFVGTKHNENKHKSGFVASIVSMSLGGGKSFTFNKAVNSLVAEGVSVVTASGNDGADACDSSPGSAGDNVNVGAHSEPVEKPTMKPHKRPTKQPITEQPIKPHKRPTKHVSEVPTKHVSEVQCMKPIAYFSNWGTCVDVVAPGVNIMSVNYAGNSGFVKMSGTSMACPHVAGAVALIMKADPSLSPAEVKQKLIDASVNDIDRSAEQKPIQDASKSKRLFVG